MGTMITQEEFSARLDDAIRNNRITLPTLPEVALKIRDAVEQDTASANKIADMVATDAALSARLLQVANSPLYRGRVTIDTIQMAVTRLGMKLVRSLVVSLAMKQIFQATSDVLDRRLRAIWENSVQVAAISRVLSQSLPHIDKDQAMLAGLIHNIGCLPILTMAESYPVLMANPELLDKFVANLNPGIGKLIMETWGFPESLAQVPANYQNYSYNSGEIADYVDIVMVARIQTMVSPPEDLPADIPAFRKLGLEPEVEVIQIEGVAEDVEEVKQIFL